MVVRPSCLVIVFSLCLTVFVLLWGLIGITGCVLVSVGRRYVLSVHCFYFDWLLSLFWFELAFSQFLSFFFVCWLLHLLWLLVACGGGLWVGCWFFSFIPGCALRFLVVLLIGCVCFLPCMSPAVCLLFIVCILLVWASSLVDGFLVCPVVFPG
ncbi:hypothetical protein SK79_01207 [Escherichia coli]|nr:hypothetical protein SK79_01207 [Escherichia coli]